MRTRSRTASALAGVTTLLLAALAMTSAAHDPPGGSKPPQHTHDRAMPHVHTDAPPEYRTMTAPTALWIDPSTLERGKAIYADKCAACHGEQGRGDGPEAEDLLVKPPSFKDSAMVAAMTDAYWFWRVSEGGEVEPFRSTGSVMPAWKKKLSVEDRWAVIAYQHTLSGHAGPPRSCTS